MDNNTSSESIVEAEKVLDWTIRDSLKRIMPKVIADLAMYLDFEGGLSTAVQRDIAEKLKSQLKDVPVSIYLFDKKPMLTMFWSEMDDPFEFSLDEIRFDLDEDHASLRQQLEGADAFIAEFTKIKAMLQAALDSKNAVEIASSVAVVRSGANASLQEVRAADLIADQTKVLVIPPTLSTTAVIGKP